MYEGEIRLGQTFVGIKGFVWKWTGQKVMTRSYSLPDDPTTHFYTIAELREAGLDKDNPCGTVIVPALPKAVAA